MSVYRSFTMGKIEQCASWNVVVSITIASYYLKTPESKFN